MKTILASLFVITSLAVNQASACRSNVTKETTFRIMALEGTLSRDYIELDLNLDGVYREASKIEITTEKGVVPVIAESATKDMASIRTFRGTKTWRHVVTVKFDGKMNIVVPAKAGAGAKVLDIFVNAESHPVPGCR